jgi:hypothetical protein
VIWPWMHWHIQLTPKSPRPDRLMPHLHLATSKQLTHPAVVLQGISAASAGPTLCPSTVFFLTPTSRGPQGTMDSGLCERCWAPPAYPIWYGPEWPSPRIPGDNSSGGVWGSQCAMRTLEGTAGPRGKIPAGWSMCYEHNWVRPHL